LIADAAALLLPLQPDESQVLELRNEWIASSALAVDIEKTKDFDRPLLAFDEGYRAYATGSIDGAVMILRTDDHREQARLSLPEDEASRPWAAKFSPDGHLLVVAYDDTTVRLWHVETKRPLLTVDLPTGQYAIDFSPDGRLLAYGDGTRNIHLLDLTTSPPSERPFPYASSEISGIPRRLRFDPAGRRIAVSYAAVIAPTRFRPDAVSPVYRPPGGRDTAPAVSPRPAEFSLRFVGIDVFDLDSPAGLRRIGRVPCSPGNVFWSPDGRFLAFGDTDFRIRIWDVESNREHAELSGHRWGGISAVFTHGGDYVTSRSWDGTSRFWDPNTGRELMTSRYGEAHTRVPGAHRVHMTTAEGASLWNIVGSSTLRCIPSTIPPKTELYRVSVHPQGRLLAAACGDGVRVVDLAAGKEIGKLPLRNCQMALFHPQDGSLLMTSKERLYLVPVQVEETEHRVRLGNATTITPPSSVWGPCASWTRGGRYLVAVAGNSVVVHDLEEETAKVLGGAHANVGTIDVSPDGRWVATGNWHGAGIMLWDTHAGYAVDALWEHVRNAGVVFSPDGLRIAACSESQYRVWEVGTWRQLYSGTRNDSGPGRKIAFSPGGEILAIATSGHLLRLLDAATGKELATLNSPYAFAINHFAFNLRGDSLAVLDRPLHVWDLAAIRDGLGQIGIDWSLPPYSGYSFETDTESLSIEDSGLFDGLGETSKVSKKFSENISRFAKEAEIALDRQNTYRNFVRTYTAKRDQEQAVGTPSASTHWHLAVSQLASGDIEGYRETCKAMLRYFAKADEDAWGREMTAWVVSLHENDEEDVTSALAVAEQLVEERRSATNLRVLGACLHRAGRVKEAEQTLREALPDAKRPAYVHLLLALTSNELGRSAEARTWLDKADPPSRSGKKPYWATQATEEVFRKQATAAIDD
jgi:WD40 repeat protein